jgi:NAD(P)-dependent dehydrogenase (short-subunit alcohol dehydrogenase family)
MRNIIVTGGNRGLGYEIVKTFANQNNHIIIACRDVEHGTYMAKKLPGSSEVIALDLCSEQSIYSFTKQLAERHSKIDVLMNNAGIFDNSGQKVTFMKQSFSNVWVTNTLGPYLLTKQMTPLLNKSMCFYE